MNEENQCLIILGMHRSGTSALSGCLHLLGADLGKNLMPANEANPAGFFENQDLVLIHDILLRDLGCHWDMVGNLPQDWLQTDAAKQAREKIERLIEREFSNSPLWAVKDPRLCRLLPLWLDLFQDKGIDPRFVIMARHPYEVAQSLNKRDGFDLLKGHLLWLVHTREALTACRDQEHTILTYDQFLADPINSLESLKSQLDIELPKQVRQHAQEIIEFVRPDLKRSTLNSEMTDLYAPYAWLYDQLRLSQAKALKAGYTAPDIEQSSLTASPTQTLEMKGFPLIAKQELARNKPESSHASAMFDNLLSIISSYEQAEQSRKVKRQRRLLEADQQGETLYAQVYFPASQDRENQACYIEDRSQKVLLAPREWQAIEVEITDPETLRRKGLRLDPLNTKGIVRISAIKLMDAVTRDVFWPAAGEDGFQEIEIKQDAFSLDHQEALILCSTGTDPQLMLPPLTDLPDRPLQLEVWIKTERQLTELAALWQEREQRLEFQTGKLEQLEQELEQSRAEQEKLQQQVDQQTQEKDRLNQQWEERKQEWTEKEQELQAEIQDKDAQLKDWADKEQEWQSREEQLQKAIHEKDQALQDKDQKQQELESANQDLKQRLQNRNKKVEQLQNQVQELEQTVSTREKELEDARSSLQNTQQTLSEKQTHLEQLHETKGQLEGSLRAKEQELEQANASLRERDEQLRARQQELDNLRKEKEKVLSEKQVFLEQAQEKTAQLEKDLKAREDDLKQAQEKVQEKDKDLQARQEEIERLRQEKEQVQAELQSKQSELEQTKEKLNTKINSLSEAKKKIHGFKGSLKNKDFSQQSTGTSSQEQEVEDLEKQVEDLKQKLAQQEELTKEYFTELAKADEELAKVQSG